jgi:hypothetical protein
MTKAAIVVVLLLGAHFNLTALVPAAPGQGQPPWWVGGGLFWPFFADTNTLVPAGALRDTVTPLLGIAAGVCLLMAAAALLGWLVPGSWFVPLVVAGTACSIVLQVCWLSGWTVLPLVLDAVLLWIVVAGNATVSALRA